MRWNMGDIWETVADTVPDSEAIVDGARRLSYREFDERAARLAQVLVDAGLTPGSKVSFYMYNIAEYLEAQFAVFKARMTGININYRYLETELIHVINDSDSEAIIFQAQFAERVAAIRDRLEKVTLFLEVADGSGQHLEGAVDYAEAVAAASPMPRIERSGDDIYMLYTGGTTGMPKGVMYAHHDFSSFMFPGGYVIRGIAPPVELADFPAAVRTAHDNGIKVRSIPACPLMHGTGLWLGAMIPLAMGGTVVLHDNSRKFDADGLWELVARENVSDILIVGDAFAKPMLDSLNAARERNAPFDLSPLKMIGSSGVMFSSDVKRGLLDHMEIIIFDGIGATEGSMGAAVTTRDTLDSDQTAHFNPNPTTKVLTEDGREVTPGSDEIGLICNGGAVPLGYYKDPEKSAKTFKTINGTRYSIPGDFARVLADGSIMLLGRGSVTINSGGEKIFPEEVEEALKSHAAVYDCLVVGVPDDRFGQKVVAVLSFTEGHSAAESELQDYLRDKIAGYKIPRLILTVPTVGRAANGKPDYKWASATALGMTA